MSTQPPLPSPEPHKYAIIDMLLKDARHFREMLSMEVARAERHNAPLSLLIGEIDHFSADHVFKAVAESLRNVTRVTDFVCKADGIDTLAIILPHTERMHACQLVQAFRESP